jgi:hypothetical protein
MKKILLLLTVMLGTYGLKAQDATLAPDQNPNYKVSLAKYTTNAEALQTTMNTTVQQTYKAYDWYEAKQERKQQRIQFRQQRAMARINNQGFFNNYNNCASWYTPGYGYRNRWCR